MKFWSYFILLNLIATVACTQVETSHRCIDPKFDIEVNSYLDYTIPVLSVDELNNELPNSYILLDARELEEFGVSHIKNAIHIGYDHFNINNITEINKEQKLIVYCSIGYRSEKIGEKLKDLGYTNVYNLYGSIFEWANQGLPLVKQDGTETKELHTYNKKWSKWVQGNQIQKVY